MSPSLMPKSTRWSLLTTAASCQRSSWTQTSFKTYTSAEAVKLSRRPLCRMVSLGPASWLALSIQCQLTISGDRTVSPSATCSSKRICFTWSMSSSNIWTSRVTNGWPRLQKMATRESIFLNSSTNYFPTQWTMYASEKTTLKKNLKWTSTIISRKHSLRRKYPWMKLCIIWSFSAWQASRKRWWTL